MIKNILVAVLLLLAPSLSFSLSIPSDFTLVNPKFPAFSFSPTIRHYFTNIQSTFEGPECSAPNVKYTLTMLIYRNAVDNTIVASYRALELSTLCWIDLQTKPYTLMPNQKAAEWKVPQPGENTWCSQAGVLNPSECSFLEAN